jgi:hypothetical protein
MIDPFVLILAKQPDPDQEKPLLGQVSWAFGASPATIVLDWLYQAVIPLAAFNLPLFVHHYIHRTRPHLTVKLPAACPYLTASNFPEVNATIFGQRHFRIPRILPTAVSSELPGSSLERVLGIALCSLIAALILLQLPFPVNAATPEPERLRQGSFGEKVTVEGRPDHNQAGHQIMALDFSGQVFTGQTGPDGRFLLEGIPAGTYTLVASSPGFLSATCGAFVHSGGSTRLNGVTLLAGDLDNSGVIDMVDVVTLSAAFGRPDLAEGADFNTDELIDVLDLILLAANLGQTTTDNPWVCQ